VTVAGRDPAAPRTVGCEYGPTGTSPAARDHGRGRVCANGCGTVLRRTNPDDICDPCQRAAIRRIEAARAAATAAREARAKASPSSRQKEKQMPDRPESDSAAAVLDLLVTGEVVSGQAIADELGCTRNAVAKHIKNLRRLGWHITSVPKLGHRLDDVKPWANPSDHAPEAPGAAPDPIPEQPASPAAPDSSSQESPVAGPPPFAGSMSVDWFESKRPTVPVTITVHFELDEIVEAVMERIAEQMVGKGR